VLLNKALSYGKLTGGIYDFEFAGDELARHTHDETTVHISIVARGSFKMVGDGWEMTAKCGDVVDFDIGQYHAFIALEPNSRLVNIVKG
jgi:quercetin dioxygenase-like cupin family protein